MSTHYKIPNRNCVNPDCGGSGWVPDDRSVTDMRYVGDFREESKTGEKWNWNTPREEVTEDRLVAIPCPDCNKLRRAAYDEGRLGYVLAHKDDPPDEEEQRRRNVEKARKKFDL